MNDGIKSTNYKKFHTRVLINVIYALIISCLLEYFIVNNVFTLLELPKFYNSENEIVVSFLRFETITVLLFVLFGIGMFTFVFWMLQRKSFGYIEDISRAMKSVASGDLNTSLEVEGDDEFSDMAQTLNTMVSDIKNLMERERESEKTKNELITNVAHDLRTPLTSIIGYLELLSKNNKIDDETRINYTKIAYTKSKKLEKLIEDLFGFTKLNYGKIAMKVEKIDLVKLISQLMEEFYPNFMEKGLAFSLTTNKSSKFIDADANLLARLFENLIGNAIKYGVDGKKIDVKIEAYHDYASVSVINYGKVIPKKELALIFEKFYRLEHSRSSETGGTGLGLAIAQNIAQMHGTFIEVKSDLNGTAFIVKLKTELDINKENFTNV
ncbi:sensor histidine kinase [Johnsonella ignava]|uniref:sensor histidine kinase n=1 Tax=Johnsonella ignava TaxID=43995 RepID=UPI0023F00885|nr:HAMP domain-containing sensor histidine kinase [Johnsonella ignava]